LSSRRPASPKPEKRINPPGLTVTTIAVFLSGCGVVLVIGGLLMWFNYTHPKRMNDRLRPFPSPDGTRQAILFRRTSLGPEPYTTHVAILPAGVPLPNRSGKAYIAEGEPNITVRWQDDNHLVIESPEDTHVILRASKVGDVKISGE
jgi:hypothetical protein